MSEEQRPTQNALRRWWSSQPRISRLMIAAVLAIGAMRWLWGFEVAVLGALAFIATYVYRISEQMRDKGN